MTFDEIFDARRKGRRIEACPETGKCKCPCHDGGETHLAPCCHACAKCGANVMIGKETLHAGKCGCTQDTV